MNKTDLNNILIFFRKELLMAQILYNKKITIQMNFRDKLLYSLMSNKIRDKINLLKELIEILQILNKYLE